MLFFQQSGITCISYSGGTEDRFVILRSEGLHLLNDPVNLEIQITESRGSIDFQFGNEITWLDGFGNNFFKFLTESFYIFGREGHARCSKMTTISDQPFPA